MSALLDEVLDAHGGLTRWRDVTGLTVDATFGGPFWGLRGFADLPMQTLQVDTRVQRISTGYDLPNHNSRQVFYYDADLHQRRMDYHPDVTGTPIAHYTSDPVERGGLTFYARRSVHRRLPDNTADLDLAVITIDTADVAVHTKEQQLCPAS